jgi:hypothetical protein
MTLHCRHPPPRIMRESLMRAYLDWILHCRPSDQIISTRVMTRRDSVERSSISFVQPFCNDRPVCPRTYPRRKSDSRQVILGTLYFHITVPHYVVIACPAVSCM